MVELQTNEEKNKMCDICSKVLCRKKDIARHKRLVHKIEPAKIEPVKKKIETRVYVTGVDKPRTCMINPTVRDVENRERSVFNAIDLYLRNISTRARRNVMPALKKKLL